LSFDDLLALLLFVAFIALPALSRLARSRGGSQGPGTPPPGGRPTTPPVPGPDRGRTQADPAASTTVRQDPDAELERRLAEARARVQQAMQGPSAPRPSPPVARPTTPALRPSSTVAGPVPRGTGLMTSVDRDDGLLSTPLDASAAASLGRKRREESRQRLADAPALEVERAVKPDAGREPQRVWLATDRRSLVQGIVWNQVLNEPRSRAPLGGTKSTRRSR
jgi:hypothetical protein